MKILSINNFFAQNSNQLQSKQYNTPFFGIKAKPTLEADTVSFKEAKFSRKKIAQAVTTLSKDVVDIKTKTVKQASKTNNQEVVKLPDATVRSILALYHKPFEHFKTHLYTTFSTLEAEGKVTLGAIPKKSFSIREKAQSLGITNKEEVLKYIADISRGRIIVNSEDSFESVIKTFSKLLKKGNFKVIDFENHRLPSKYLGNGNFSSNDAFDITQINRLKQIATNSNYELQTKDIDSHVGYSGIHITLQDENGFKHELQIITKGMFKVKEPEDLLYKIKAGKMLEPKYQTRLYPKLKILRPVEEIEVIGSDKKVIKQAVFKDTLDKPEPEVLTDEMKEIRKRVFKYTKDAYKYALEHPYTDNVLPAPEGLEKFDFARIFNEMLQCK